MSASERYRICLGQDTSGDLQKVDSGRGSVGTSSWQIFVTRMATGDSKGKTGRVEVKGTKNSAAKDFVAKSEDSDAGVVEVQPAPQKDSSQDN